MKDALKKKIAFIIVVMSFLTILVSSYALASQASEFPSLTDIKLPPAEEITTPQNPSLPDIKLPPAEEITRPQNPSLPDVKLPTVTDTEDNNSKAEPEEDDDETIYTIEDVIFNRIPILDINFFSEKAAGEEIKEGSVVYILRQIVATWYVSFRNLVIMALAIIFVYTGIRIAISTIPSNKAKYKKMLFGLIQSIAIILVIHYIMYIIININETIVSTAERANVNSMLASGWKEESIYDTIRTRANDIRFSVGVPAMIMYAVLVITWIRFLWVYIKRSFTILILVIIAPFIGAKYAIDSSSGKKGTSITSWLYDFTMNVLLQSVHAIIYVALIGTALNLSIQSLSGFVIALVLFNFMLSADKIFRDIFNFDKSKLIKDTAQQQEGRDIIKDFAGISFMGQMAKGSIDLVKGAGGTVIGVGKFGYKLLVKYNPNAEDSVNSRLNKIDEGIEKIFDPSKNPKNDILKDIQNAVYYRAKIRRLARNKGTMGIKARRIKAKLKSRQSKRYKSNYKFVKDSITGVGDVILAIPLTVINPTAGVALMAKGVKNLNQTKAKDQDSKKSIKNIWKKVPGYKVYYASKKAKQKYEKKRDTIYKSIKQLEEIDEQQKDIINKFESIKNSGNVSEDDINRFKESASLVALAAHRTKMMDTINKYMEDNNLENIDILSIHDIIDTVVEQVGDDLKFDDADKGLLRGESLWQLTNGSRDPNETYSRSKVIKTITDNLINETIDDQFKDIANDIIKLEDKINQAEKTAKTNYRHVNKFLENL